MKEILNIQQELKEISPLLASIEKEANLWPINPQYFEELGLQISKKRETSQSYNVPKNYFNDLSTNIINKVNESDISLENNKTNPYKTPANYFETLPSQINLEIKKPKAKFIKMKRNWMAAASVFLVLSLSIMFFLKPTQSEPNILANKTVLKEGLQLAKNEVALNTAIDNLSSDEIETFITEQENILPILDIVQTEQTEVNNTTSDKEQEELENLFNELEESI